MTAEFETGLRSSRRQPGPEGTADSVRPVAQRAATDVLVVDDDQGLREALQRGLSLEGFAVRESSDGAHALAEVAARPPRAVVLDVVMPGLSGVEVVKELRTAGHRMPVCIVSARDEIDDRVAGLRAGADDYVVKPFSIQELAARLHALVRLHETSDSSVIFVGDLTLDPARRIATRAGRDLALTSREFDLLIAFTRSPSQVLSRVQLLDQVWGYTWDVDTNVVDVFVSYLRKKMEADNEPRMLQTVRGVGFGLRP
jgi:DNA-binding response OmpR family regulator